MNIVEKMPLVFECAPFVFMPNSAIAGSLGRLIPSFMRNSQTLFQSDCTSLHSHQQWRSVLLILQPFQHRLSFMFLNLAILTCGTWKILLHFWWECKLVQSLWNAVWRFLRKLWIILPKDPAIPLLGIYPKDSHSYFKGIMFIAALSVIARTWKQPRCHSTEEWIHKLWYIYTMEYYSAVKKKTS